MRAPRTLIGLTAAVLMAAGFIVPSAAPASATFPGVNGRIAFDDYLTGQIYAVNPDGTGLMQLTHAADGEFSMHPAWSPDSKHIAFTSTMSGSWRLWVMDADGGGLHKVASDVPGVDAFAPSYTPNGRRLLFTRCREDPRPGCGLFSIRTDGTGRHALTPVPFDAADFWPSVSPDGRKILFTRFNAHGIIAQVYVMRADGSGLHALTSPALEAFGPDWSPDGRHVTFSSNVVRLPANIYVMNPDGTGIQRLTDASYPNNDFFSGYSPDGRSIAFSSDRRYDDFCCSELFVMAADGSYEARLPIENAGVNTSSWGSAPPISASSRPAPSLPRASSTRTRARRAAVCEELPVQISPPWCGASG